MFSNASKAPRTVTRSASRSISFPGPLLTAPGLIVGIVLGFLIASPSIRQRDYSTFIGGKHKTTSIYLDQLSPDELRAVAVKTLSEIEDQQEMSGTEADDRSDSSEEPLYYSRQVRQGIENMRRLLGPAKQLAIESLREAAAGCDLRPPDWAAVIHLVDGASKIVHCHSFEGVAEVREGRLSTIFVDSAAAPDLISDDEATFVLGHELMHIAARSGKLVRFIDSVAETSKRLAFVEPTKAQKEDLACDFLGELVLRHFIAINPTRETVAARISKALGYETPAVRFERAWEDLCDPYLGDPGDKEHLSQYKTIRALLAVDPELSAIIPMPVDSLCQPRPYRGPRE